jgi:DNA-binding XRE family transcriptional regulator
MEARTLSKDDLPDWVISSPGEIHPTLGGDDMLSLADCFAPRPSEFRQMLLKLRRHHRWSQGVAAAILGASRSTLVKWELGLRSPSGPAAKMIFLLYHLLIEKQKVKNCWDLAVWGRVPCRGDGLDQLSLALVGTYFVSNNTMLQFAAEDGERSGEGARTPSQESPYTPANQAETSSTGVSQ